MLLFSRPAPRLSASLTPGLRPATARAAACLATLLAASCGRTGLDVEDVELIDVPAGSAASDGGVKDAASEDAQPDALPDALPDAQPDAQPDAPPDAQPDAPPEAGCASSAQCDDGIGCTADACVGGVCQHTPVDEKCDDGLFCTGKEACNPSTGCVTFALNCDDGVACTVESCDEGAQACVNTPDDSLCPVSHKCGAGEGCYALAYAHSADFLYEVRLPSGKVSPIGELGTQLTDIALSQSGTLYGLSYTALYEIDVSNGNASFVTPVSAQSMVAMDVAPDGTFYTGSQALYVIDPQAGVLKKVASYPQGYTASGDLAFLGGRLLASASQQGSATDMLVELDINGAPAKLLGDMGYDCVWGLAAFGDTLYGLTCNGHVLSVNTQTGASTLLGETGIQFWGASAR
jgi:hypothetical protein